MRRRLTHATSGALESTFHLERVTVHSSVVRGGKPRDRSGRALLAVVACGLALLSAAAKGVPEDIASGLAWRLVGPFRAGWGTAVAGVPDAPDIFYFGAAGGGVWKTTNAGHTW